MKKKPSISPVSDERLELLFRHAGLSEKQAKLYRLLLETGEERASVLSRRSGIKRGNVYALLADLAAHGLVTGFEKENIAYFRPEPPAKLLAIVEAREKEVSVTKHLASDLLPHLTTQWKAAVGRPVVQYFEGEKGLHDVFDDIYAPGKSEVYGCVDLEQADAAFPRHIATHLIPKRVKNAIVAKSFIADSPKAHTLQSQDVSHLRESVLLDKTAYPLPAEIDVYEDKIAMLSFQKDEFIGIIIQNSAFAQSLTSIFKLAHENLRRGERQGL